MLNVSINPIWRNFLDRGFFVFRWVKKKVWWLLFGDFCADLKHNFNIWFWKVMSLKDLLVSWSEFLEPRIWVFEENWIYRSSDILLMEKISQKFLARTPRAYVYKPMKLGDILRKSQICIKFVVFYRSNIKNEIWILQDIPRTLVKYFARARAPTSPNEAQKFRCYAHF